jgi:L-serine dehydratase
MNISVLDIFKIGVGPSSSHTVGPMRAARAFARALEEGGHLARTARVITQLYGSLALTGKGHGTDRAIILGLLGATPDGVDPDQIEALVQDARDAGRLTLLGTHVVRFDEPMDLLFLRTEVLARHPNGMRFTALDADDRPLHAAEYFSVGGGFIVRGDEPEAVANAVEVRRPFASAAELLARCRAEGVSIAELVRRNETAFRSEAETQLAVDRLIAAMRTCVERGMRVEGLLPGGLSVKRRAAELRRKLEAEGAALQGAGDPLAVMDWVNVFALAVNEENAAGGRVVTAPTNGAAGIVPAVLEYYLRFAPGATEQGAHGFVMTAAAIGMLYKRNASISGAEMGCQGEVGVACSMAAGGLAAALGGTLEQVENAAEIGMEHNLGLTCDPVAGLVQIPCIERNAIGAVKAINAARMALRGDGSHKVSLDQVIATMRQTGLDMQTKYKETSLGGLAVNVVEC